MDVPDLDPGFDKLTWAQAHYWLYRGHRVRRAAWPAAQNFDLKAGLYRLFIGKNGLQSANTSPTVEDMQAEDWEKYTPVE